VRKLKERRQRLANKKAHGHPGTLDAHADYLVLHTFERDWVEGAGCVRRLRVFIGDVSGLLWRVCGVFGQRPRTTSWWTRRP
jgi:hypothetical protein